MLVSSNSSLLTRIGSYIQDMVPLTQRNIDFLWPGYPLRLSGSVRGNTRQHRCERLTGLVSGSDSPLRIEHCQPSPREL